MAPSPTSAQRSPLTDPRSVFGSLLFHGALVLVASLFALSVAGRPMLDEPTQALQGELESVDNHASTEGGGGTGELGGEGLLEALPVSAGTSPTGEGRDASVDSLLSEILPPAQNTDLTSQALPGPQTSGLGVLPGPGVGGGGGAGNGSGGGVGRGIGPGTEFFGAKERAGSYTYVIDCSGSMATRNALDVAKRELLASLGRLPDEALFGIVFYNLQAKSFMDTKGVRALMPATAANKDRVRTQLDQVVPDGGTDHMVALREGLSRKPEVIFFLTDADLMTNSDVNEILALAGKTRIHAIEFGRGPEVGGSGPLKRLAKVTGGGYRYHDVTTFPRR